MAYSPKIKVQFFQGKARGPSAHDQIGTFRKFVENVFRDPLTEKLLLRISTQVCERENRDSWEFVLYFSNQRRLKRS
jgi:hypothetical protein